MQRPAGSKFLAIKKWLKDVKLNAKQFRNAKMLDAKSTVFERGGASAGMKK